MGPSPRATRPRLPWPPDEIRPPPGGQPRGLHFPAKPRQARSRSCCEQIASPPARIHGGTKGPTRANGQSPRTPARDNS
eukprot:3449606-Pyramimonas_sp.AAC.1